VRPRDRVIDVIEHRRPDRVPLYGWVRANLEAPIRQAFGSVEAFEDHYEFDYAHLFGGPNPYDGDRLTALRRSADGPLRPDHLLDLPPGDPHDLAAYQGIVDGVRHHKQERDRFVYVQTPGIFECLNGVFGIEEHLGYLLLYERELHEIYRRQAAWNQAFAHHCLDLGVDMVHVSDDWGGQQGLLFSPALWQRLIYPYHQSTCRSVKDRGAYLSFHSDGNIRAVLDGVVELGFDVVHPFQESAGMDLAEYRRRYWGTFVVMGGLDVQTTIGFGRLEVLQQEIERVLRQFADGGLLFCTSHFVQDHCTIDELVLAFDTAYRLSREVVR
jgi:uroporphyrinogen decarboxylase